MIASFRPMLACSYDDVEIKFPVMATPKFDGIRCITSDIPAPPGFLSVPLTRSLKQVPNDYIREKLAMLPPGLDGEIMTYDGDKMNPFQKVQSDVMSHNGIPSFIFRVFDRAPLDGQIHEGYYERICYLVKWFAVTRAECVRLVIPVNIKSQEALDKYEEKCIADGYEGVCFRQPDSPYKYGRSTPKQQWLVKMKRFETAEARVVGVVEERHNANPAKTSELGYQKRSSHQQNMIGKERLGALICEPLEGGERFQIGSGFDATQRENMWLLKGKSVIGKIAQYKHQPHGRKDKPRTPIFLRFRDPRDMDKQPVVSATNEQKELL